MPSIHADIDLCRKEYIKQRKLEKIVSQRQLKRPNTKKWHILLLFSIVPLLLFCSVLFCFIWQASTVYRLLVFVLLLLFIFELYVRFCLVQTVKCYQHYAKEETRRRCMCVPSCSEFAIICLKRIFPLAFALIKIRIRLYRTCKGEDYKLDFPLKKMNFEYEKKHLS